ncbi:MAG: leucyl/phenylalanyl-tRNA--protein transferase, partial [Deltaproteobacteria bacterium]|nr:leucyl/phenylalanyl-tRNA--protein transferase [Deltaproteobacteria bacterium]
MPVYQLSGHDLTFPPARLAEPDGLLAVGGDLSLPRLLAAYSQGIFPWYAEGLPILWYSTHPRCVLFPEKLHVPRSLARLLRQGKFIFSVNQSFATVIRQCAATPRPGQPGTWILPEMIQAYCELHEAGYAHSVEVWQGENLVGGLYGVALGRVFFGESMFYAVPDASKAAV